MSGGVRHVAEYDGQLLLDREGGIYISSGAWDCAADDEGTLELTLPPGHRMAGARFAKGSPDHEVRLFEDGEERFRGCVSEVTGAADGSVTIKARGQLGYLADTIVRPYATTAAPDVEPGTRYVPGDLLTHLLVEHNRHAGPSKAFSVGDNPHAQTPRVQESRPSTLDELRDALCTGQDRYLRARTAADGSRVVDVVDGGEGEGDQTIVLGENLLDLTWGEQESEAATAIVAIGRMPQRDDGEAAAEDAEGWDDPEARREAEEAREFGLDSLGSGTYVVGDVTVAVDGDRASSPRLVGEYGVREEKREYEASSPRALLACVAADLDPRSLSFREVTSVEAKALDVSRMNPEVGPLRLLTWYRVYAPALGVDQWMLLTEAHIDLCDPAQSYYRFGDLPKTLKRESALRVGMSRRAAGGLVRRSALVGFNADRSRDRAEGVDGRITDEVLPSIDDVEGHVGRVEGELQGALDEWAKNLDDANAKWYSALDDAQKEAAQGREDLLRQLEELENEQGGLIEGVREQALAARRTYYATCRTAASDAAKLVAEEDLTAPGGEALSIEAGAVVDVLFTDGSDAAGDVTLAFGQASGLPVVTNGARQLFAQRNAVVRLVYDGAAWQALGAVFGTEATIGNPAQANFYTDGTKMALRIGEKEYLRADASGERVGMDGMPNVRVADTSITFTNGKNVLSFDVDEENGADRISTGNMLVLEALAGSGVDAWLSLGATSDFGGFDAYSKTSVSLNAGTGHAIMLCSDTLYTAASGGSAKRHPVVRKSIVKSVSNKDSVNVTASELGIQSTSHYSFSVTNGDFNALGCYPIGTACNYGSNLLVCLDRAVTGNLRLNIVGWQTDNALLPGSDEPMPGPSI